MGRPANPTRGFGGVVRELRLERRLTQAELAAQVGLTPAYVARVETDPTTRPSQAVIQRFARALGVSEAALMEAGGHVPPEVARACGQTPAEMLWFARLSVADRRLIAAKHNTDARGDNERRVRAIVRRLKNA